MLEIGYFAGWRIIWAANNRSFFEYIVIIDEIKHMISLPGTNLSSPKVGEIIFSEFPSFSLHFGGITSVGYAEQNLDIP